MEYQLKFSVDNAAFEENMTTEIARILTMLAYDMERNGFKPCKIRDVNGNEIGESKLAVE